MNLNLKHVLLPYHQKQKYSGLKETCDQNHQLRKMALKDRLRSQRSKRFGNVANNYDSRSEGMNFSSSDSEPGDTLHKTKVRRRFSAKSLMKESEYFEIDNDHIYTSAKSHENGEIGNEPLRSCGTTRKRKISQESDDKPTKQRCFSKNAVMARLNRERKKMYVSSLETVNEDLRKQNNEFNRKVEMQNKTISAMKREILYLKGLLANSKEIGEILKNLKETTHLPVTSSLIPTNQTNNSENCFSKVESVPALEDSYHPRIRSVNSGTNFPILDKDINLGSCSDKSFSFSDIADLENYPFDFENDTYEAFSQDDSIFNFNTQNLDLELEDPFKFEDPIDKNSPDVGICLHVNQKRISVEICSICNSKARSSWSSCHS